MPFTYPIGEHPTGAGTAETFKEKMKKRNNNLYSSNFPQQTHFIGVLLPEDIIISRKSGQKIPKIANLQYYKSKANYGTKKKGISR